MDQQLLDLVMRRLSRYSILGIAALVIVLVGTIFVLTRGGDTSATSHPEATERPSKPAPTQPSEAGTKGALTAGFAIAFEAAAPGASRTIRWAPVVRYFMGGQPVRTINAEEANDPSAWTGCPQETNSYAERDCPVSMRGTVDFAVEGGDLVAEARTPSIVGCDKVKLPARVEGMRAGSLRPGRAHRDCFSDFAITLYVNSSDQVAAVNFVLSSP